MNKFNFVFAEYDPSGYYITNWRKSIPVTVVAETKTEAVEKAKKALGGPRTSGFRWTYKVSSVEVTE